MSAAPGHTLALISGTGDTWATVYCLRKALVMGLVWRCRGTERTFDMALSAGETEDSSLDTGRNLDSSAASQYAPASHGWFDAWPDTISRCGILVAGTITRAILLFQSRVHAMECISTCVVM